jgi:hypothetical protein
MQIDWRPGVTCQGAQLCDRATGVVWSLPAHAEPIVPVRALEMEAGLERLVVANARRTARWSVYRRCLAGRQWRRAVQAVGLFAPRYTCRSPLRAACVAAKLSAPLAGATALATAVVFLPVYVAAGFPRQVVIGIVATALLLWSSVAVHELAHALVAIGHRGVVYLERRVLTPSVLVGPVPGTWGVAHAVAGPVAGAASCVPAAVVLQSHQLGLVAPAIALVHLSNLSTAAGDGRYLRAAVRRRRHWPVARMSIAGTGDSSGPLAAVVFDTDR